MKSESTPYILVTGPNKVDSHGVRKLSYMFVDEGEVAHVNTRVVDGDRDKVRRQLAEAHSIPEGSVHFDPHYDDTPTPDFSYEFREADYELGLTTLGTKRYSCGAAGIPNDVKVGWEGQVWFSGSANCFGRFDEARNLTVIARNVGHMPTIMRDEFGTGNYGWRFIDPQGGRIGFIRDDGRFGDEIELDDGAHPMLLGPHTNQFKRSLVVTDTGMVIDLDGDRRFRTWTGAVDAIGIADDSVWQIAQSRLVNYYAGYMTGERWQALQGGDSKPGYMVPGAPNALLIYMDPGRDVIGFVESHDKILEVKLPAGTGIRSMHVVTESSIWFTGKNGQSLFRLDRQRTVKEYRCATADSDLYRIDHGSDCLWFTEPKHTSITRADISNL